MKGYEEIFDSLSLYFVCRNYWYLPPGKYIVFILCACVCVCSLPKYSASMQQQVGSPDDNADESTEVRERMKERRESRE